MVIDRLAERLGAKFSKHKANAMVAETRLGIGQDKLILAKPLSYMNTSGGPVANLSKFYGIEPANVIVIHDELDIRAEDVRIKFGGGHAGHNGLRDIIAALGTNDYVRVRVGIGRPPGSMDTADFVLKNFSAAEKKELPTTLEIAADAAVAIVKDGLAAAQQRFHS
jgi:PTH1 family peptidyl-tRNA hydrolase